MAPASLSLLTATFTEHHERRRALGVWSATASSGAAGGLFLGGLLTDLLGWRWVLFVNVPIVPLRTFRRRSLTLANIQSTAVGA